MTFVPMAECHVFVNRGDWLTKSTSTGPSREVDVLRVLGMSVSPNCDGTPGFALPRGRDLLCYESPGGIVLQ